MLLQYALLFMAVKNNFIKEEEENFPSQWSHGERIVQYIAFYKNVMDYDESEIIKHEQY